VKGQRAARMDKKHKQETKVAHIASSRTAARKRRGSGGGGSARNGAADGV